MSSKWSRKVILAVSIFFVVSLHCYPFKLKSVMQVGGWGGICGLKVKDKKERTKQEITEKYTELNQLYGNVVAELHKKMCSFLSCQAFRISLFVYQGLLAGPRTLSQTKNEQHNVDQVLVLV